MGVWEYLNIVVSNSQCCCEFYLLGHTYSFWKIKWNFNDPCNQTGSLRHKTVLETGYKNGNKSVNLAQHCWFQLAEHDCEQWDVSDNSRRTSTMEIKKKQYKKIVEDMTICKWLSSQKMKNADLDILSHRKYRKGAECSSRWTSRWCGMSGNVPIWIFPPVFDTVTFWCCVFTVWSSVESVDGAGGAGGGRGRELCIRHIWAHHRLCIAIGCGSYAAACQQDGLPHLAVLTLIILVSPRTYRKSLCHF